MSIPTILTLIALNTILPLITTRRSPRTSSAPFPITSLPPELLDLIISHLATSPSTLLSCALVHPSWTHISRSHLTLTLPISSPSHSVLDSPHETLSPSITRLALKNALLHTSNDPLLRDTFPHITSLTLAYPSHPSLAHLIHTLSVSTQLQQRLIALCIDLTAAELRDTDTDSDAAFNNHISLPRLRTLRILGWNNILIRFLGANISGTLECLELRSRSESPTTRISEANALIQGNKDTLKDLKLEFIRRDVTFDLSSLPSLQTLSVASGFGAVEKALDGWKLPPRSGSLKRIYLRDVVHHLYSGHCARAQGPVREVGPTKEITWEGEILQSVLGM